MRLCSLLVLLPILSCAGLLTAQDKTPAFGDLYSKLRTYPSDPCDGSWDAESGKLEEQLLLATDERIRSALNTDLTYDGAPQRARAVLTELASRIGRPGVSTGKAALFESDVLALEPMVVVKLRVRTHDAFVAYALTEETWPKKHTEWHAVASSLYDDPVPWTQIEVRPLKAGPAAHTRFLAVIHFGGCAGSSGIRYRGYQWDPETGVDMADSILELDGAVGMDPQPGSVTKKNPFPTIGTLGTSGSRITLPYCIWSGMDWWDNPSLCLVDTFDMGGDMPRFVSRRYNRPELVPIAKAIEYTKKHELPELRAFCASNEVAERLLAQGRLGGPGASDPEVTVLAPGRKRVHMEEGGTFLLVLRGQRWLITGYSAD